VSGRIIRARPGCDASGGRLTHCSRPVAGPENLAMKLRVGLVGLGDDWSSRYRPALRTLADRFEIRAVCEEVAHLGEQAAQEFSAARIDGYRQLAARGDVDAMLLLAPQWYGPLPIFAACEAGKAVYCASLLDIDHEQAKRVKQRVDAAGIAFMAEFARRQSPATLRLKELIATRLGQPKLVFCHRRWTGVARPTNGSRRRAAQGIWRELLELVDWCRFVIGAAPTSVLSTQHVDGAPPADDYQVLSLDFSTREAPGSGAMAQISCASYARPAWQEAASFRRPADLQVCCERGIAFIDLPATVIWFDEAGQHRETLDSERPVGEQLLSQFHRSVTSLVRDTSSMEDAFRALLIVQAARQSFAEGRRVELPPETGS